MAGKDQEILYLKQENESTKRRYEEIYGTKLEDLAEVRVYSGLIVPEIQRMRRSVLTFVRSVQTCLKLSIFILEQSGSVSGQSQVSLRSVSGQSQVSLR